MSQEPEPKQAFPYKPPTDEIKVKYKHIFELKETLPPWSFKVCFDKLVAIVMLVLSAPIFLLLKIAHVIEGWLLPENKGPMFFYYNSISAGRVIPKYLGLDCWSCALAAKVFWYLWGAGADPVERAGWGLA